MSVSATSSSKTVASMEANVEATSDKPLERVPCIHYPIRFRKQLDNVRALIDSGSEVNAMHPALAKKLGLITRKTDVEAQKIDST